MPKFDGRLFLASLITLSIQAATAHETTPKSEVATVWVESFGFTRASCEMALPSFELQKESAALEGQVIEVLSHKAILPVTNRTIPVSGSFWQVASEGDVPSVKSCVVNGKTQSFLFYDVYVPDQSFAIAQVGLPSNETSLFATAQRHSIEAAESILASRSQITNPSGELQAPSDAGGFVPSLVSNRTASLTAGVEAIDGSLDYIACTSGSLNVRDETLNSVLFQVPKHASLKMVQSFGTDRVSKVIGGVTYQFIQIQASDLPEPKNIGWVAEDYVRLRSQCAGASAPAPTPSPTPAPVSSRYTFPTIKRPSTSYRSGMMRFKASRGGGKRYHAACDLYRVLGEEAVAVTTGTIIRDRYYFYEGTYAIEVRHSDGRVVRYGEITGKAAPGVGLNKSVSAGQSIGYIGKVNSGCCTPMLHFEMYAGTKSGSLSTSGNKFQRRSDLLDPTSYLQSWEKSKFGVSY